MSVVRAVEVRGWVKEVLQRQPGVVLKLVTELHSTHEPWLSIIFLSRAVSQNVRNYTLC